LQVEHLLRVRLPQCAAKLALEQLGPLKIQLAHSALKDTETTFTFKDRRIDTSVCNLKGGNDRQGKIVEKKRGHQQHMPLIMISGGRNRTIRLLSV
jgi:hypothetical protein